MSAPGASRDPEDAPRAIAEWQVDVALPAQTAPTRESDPADWSPSRAGEHRMRVREELESWQAELDERTRRLEERLRGMS